MKIGITGATGFIGKNLVNELKDKHELYCFDSKNLDITKEIELPEVDVLIHLAAHVKKCMFSKDKEPFYSVNARGTENIVSAAIKVGVKRIIYVSSIAVYKNPIKTALTDEVGMNDLFGTYGASKLEGEKIIKESEMPYTILRISNPFGCGSIKGIYYDLKNNLLFWHPLSEFNLVSMDVIIEEIKKSISETGNSIRNVYGENRTLISLYDEFGYKKIIVKGVK
jgi:nucleoside-diphosphate-sugar epimerase